jgi:outer membrane protein, heavy metal efflux system
MLPRIHRVAAGLAMTIVMARPGLSTADPSAAPAALDEATFLRRFAGSSPRRAAIDERRRAANAAVDVAGVRPNPQLSYEREAVPGLDTHDDFFRLGYALDLSGRRGLAVDAARAGAAAERATADRDAQVAEIDARLAYLDAVHARELVARLETARTSLAELADALRSRAAQGDASGYDAERAILELDLLEDERTTAARKLATAQRRLGALLGEPGTSYDASDPLTVPARPEASSIEPVRPEVDAARARAQQADREARAAGRRWFPELHLTVGLMLSGGPDGDGVGYIVGIGGDLPIFDGGGAAEARGRAEARRWDAEARAITVEATGEAELARIELISRIDQAEAFLAGPAVRAVDLQRRAGVAYREGDRPILELLDVHRIARDAAVRGAEAIYEARRAELALRRAMGGVR